jgi:addiction module HigA family antidote
MVRIPKYGPPTHPGEMLMEEFLKPLKITQSELAEKLGVSYPRVNEVIHAKRGITMTQRFVWRNYSAWRRSFG